MLSDGVDGTDAAALALPHGEAVAVLLSREQLPQQLPQRPPSQKPAAVRTARRSGAAYLRDTQSLPRDVQPRGATDAACSCSFILCL